MGKRLHKKIMSQPRLFITGDSWTRWYRPYHHWVRYLKNHYEVFNYGKAGLNNYEIITTLHNLPPYKSGDRLIIFFTHCARPPLSYYGEMEDTKGRPVSRSDFKNKKLFSTMEEIRDQETERWISGERSNEVNFIKYLPILLAYNASAGYFVLWKYKLSSIRSLIFLWFTHKLDLIIPAGAGFLF